MGPITPGVGVERRRQCKARRQEQTPRRQEAPSRRTKWNSVSAEMGYRQGKWREGPCHSGHPQELQDVFHRRMIRRCKICLGVLVVEVSSTREVSNILSSRQIEGEWQAHMPSAPLPRRSATSRGSFKSLKIWLASEVHAWVFERRTEPAIVPVLVADTPSAEHDRGHDGPEAFSQRFTMGTDRRSVSRAAANEPRRTPADLAEALPRRGVVDPAHQSALAGFPKAVSQSFSLLEATEGLEQVGPVLRSLTGAPMAACRAISVALGALQPLLTIGRCKLHCPAVSPRIRLFNNRNQITPAPASEPAQRNRLFNRLIGRLSANGERGADLADT
jgi:hypothetical protein